MSRLIVDAPTPPPRKFGLYSVADVQTVNANSHALMGIEYASGRNCAWNMNTITGALCGPGTSKTMTEAYSGSTTYDPFALYAYEECAGVGQWDEAKNRATDLFVIGEERGVEAAFYGKLIAAGATNLTPGTMPSLVKGVALLEDWIDDVYAGAGTILTTRSAVSLLTQNGTVSRKGDHLETEQGTRVFGSANIAPNGPANAAPAAGNVYLWAVGKITVRRGPMFAEGPFMVQNIAGANEVQTVTITGTPTGGNYTLTYDGATTGNIAYNANAATVQTALTGLSTIGAGNATVTGTNPNFTVTFGGALGQRNVGQITATPALTGGTTPSVTVGTTTTGATPTGDNSYRVLAERGFVVDWDCLTVATQAVYA